MTMMTMMTILHGLAMACYGLLCLVFTCWKASRSWSPQHFAGAVAFAFAGARLSRDQSLVTRYGGATRPVRPTVRPMFLPILAVIADPEAMHVRSLAVFVFDCFGKTSSVVFNSTRRLWWAARARLACRQCAEEDWLPASASHAHVTGSWGRNGRNQLEWRGL